MTRPAVRESSDAAAGALVGAFVGDALGMPYEGRPAREIPGSVEMRAGRAPAGSYTDDTQMMIALAESLVRCGTVDEDDLASTFREHFDERRGYGSGTRAVIGLWEAGVPVSEAAQRLFDGTGSLRNGAAMRVAPIGVRFHRDENRLIAEARRSAGVTHTHPEGVDGAVVQAVAVGAAMRGEPPFPAAVAAARTPALERRLEALSRLAGHELDPRVLGGSGGKVPFTAAGSVPVAVALGSFSAGFEEAVTIAVRSGGDTDTVAAMAGAIAGARFGLHAIPRRWYRALENGQRGRDHVERLARELAEAAAA